MRSTVAGGRPCLPHGAVLFFLFFFLFLFTMPETRGHTRKNVEHVREVDSRPRQEASASSPDLWIISPTYNARAVSSTMAGRPSPCHVGGEASGDLPGEKCHWTNPPSEIGFEIVARSTAECSHPAHKPARRRMIRPSEFRLNHPGQHDPSVTIYVKPIGRRKPTDGELLPPHSGQEGGRIVTPRCGLKTVVMSSGGMSHFPGTELLTLLFQSGDFSDWDSGPVEKLGPGHLKSASSATTNPSSTTPAI